VLKVRLGRKIGKEEKRDGRRRGNWKKGRKREEGQEGREEGRKKEGRNCGDFFIFLIYLSLSCGPKTTSTEIVTPTNIFIPEFLPPRKISKISGSRKETT
jgi:hypothetical protein